MRFCLVGLAVALLHLPVLGEDAPSLVLCCTPDNDLYAVLRGSGVRCARYDSPDEALKHLTRGNGLLLLADGYPASTTRVDSMMTLQAGLKGARLYVEYPSWLPGGPTASPRQAGVERVVVRTGFFGPRLNPLRILSLNGLRFIPVEERDAHVVAARVAGFDVAVYGLPEEVHPLLFESSHHPGLLVATTKLSGFVTGRFAPYDAWRSLWEGIIGWLLPGRTLPHLSWTPTVRPSFSATDPLPDDIEQRAFERGVNWFVRSGLLLHTARVSEARSAIERGAQVPPPSPGSPTGDGSHGIMEALLSSIQRDGSQLLSPALRGDCHGESAMALALAGRLLGADSTRAIADRLLNFWYFASGARDGARGNPDSTAYGLIAWGVGSRPWFVANYGDDNARLMLGTLAAASLLDSSRWDEPVMRCMLANLRTTGRLGFRGDRIDLDELSMKTWRDLGNRDLVSYSPHMEAYLWACFLWAYETTRDPLFLERAENALRMTMAVYPSGWRWMNGLAQERARILLPLAWLVRVSDTPEHRRWLRTAVDGLLRLQAPCGAIREELGDLAKGAMPPPRSNDDYGGGEASLIQQNGDPVSDQLYTTNFALLGLHEAAAVGDSAGKRGEDRLAAYLCRIQVRSDVHSDIDGGWFRSFDFVRWEPWGSNADAGWGAWSIESGWTQAWITSVLGMRRMRTSLWELTTRRKMRIDYARMRRDMLPDHGSAPDLRREGR